MCVVANWCGWLEKGNEVAFCWFWQACLVWSSMPIGYQWYCVYLCVKKMIINICISIAIVSISFINTIAISTIIITMFIILLKLLWLLSLPLWSALWLLWTPSSLLSWSSSLSYNFLIRNSSHVDILVYVPIISNDPFLFPGLYYVIVFRHGYCRDLILSCSWTDAVNLRIKWCHKFVSIRGNVKISFRHSGRAT